MKPYYVDESVTLFHGDMRQIVPQLPTDEHHFHVLCDDRPDCKIPKHHRL